MESSKYCENLGKLVSNLLSLEFALRAFLRINEATNNDPLYQINMNSLQEGYLVPENAFTNYDSLRELINKYNSNSVVFSKGLVIDEMISHIRDAIAHGRVFSNNPNDEMNLLKFSKPRKDGNIVVMFSARLTQDWFGEQIKNVYDAIFKVQEAIKEIQNNKL